MAPHDETFPPLNFFFKANDDVKTRGKIIVVLRWPKIRRKQIKYKVTS